MSATADPNVIARALDWLKARMSRNNELAQMSNADLQFLASDIGISSTDLRQVVLQTSDHSDLMDRMIRARGLDPAEVRRALNGSRHMEITCALCLESGICRRELEGGTAGANSHEFCANAQSMDDMLEILVHRPPSE